MPATGEGPNDHAFVWIQFGEHPHCDVPQPACHPMTLDRGADGLADHQPDPRTGNIGARIVTAHVYDDVGLYCPHPSLDRRAEFGRAGHAVLRREHRS